MRKPQSAPTLEDVLQEFLRDPTAFSKIVELSRREALDAKYLHWHKLRYHEPPDGYTHRQWWAALKLARSIHRKEIPLHDAAGTPFAYNTPDCVLESLHWIDQQAAGRIQVPDPQVMNVHERDRYIQSSLMEEAITSSQVEGAATTRVVAKEMLRSGRKPVNKDEQMILNNFRAMQHIRAMAGEALTRRTLMELHRMLTLDTLDDASAAGRPRKPHEKVTVTDMRDNEVLHIPPPAEQLDARLEAMCRFANAQTPRGFVHPVTRAILLHFWLAYDHPFVDGNGRTARALFYWSMLRDGYWLCEFLPVSPIIRNAYAKYERAFLYTETDENDLTYFLIYHLELIAQAVAQLHMYVRRKADAVREVERKLKAQAGFNHRQLALLSHALRHSDATYTVRSHQTSHNVVPQTARTDLYDLEAKGLLVRSKRGKTLLFRPAPDLPRRLETAQ